MSTQTKPRLTPQEYLEIERKAERKSEYYDGNAYAMAGAHRNRSTLQLALPEIWGPQIAGRDCAGYGSDTRVRVAKSVLHTCDVLFEDDDTLLNPTVIPKNLSPSTESYYRGEKF